MPRLKGNTKEIILEESLKLFSINGFEAVSIRDIADKVGIGNSALYKHFSCKQAILDALIEELKSRYLNQCATITSDIRGLDNLESNILNMFEFQTANEWIVNFRQLLLIEKFKNPKMAALYKEFFVDIPLNSQEEIFKTLQDKGLMIQGDTRVFAMELYAPFYLYHLVDFDYDTLKKQFREHIRIFFDEHFIKEDRRTIC